MRHLLLFAALLACASLAQAAAPAAYTAQYEVRRNGEAMGTATVSFSARGGGSYELRTHTVGTGGLAALAGADIEEKSLLAWRDGRPETQSYSYRQKVAWKTKQRSIVVDADARRIDSRDGDKSYSPPYEAGVLDRHAVNVALMQDLASGASGDRAFRVPQRDRIDTQRYRVMGRETLQTALGAQQTVRVERVRDSADGRKTTVWFGSGQRFIPLRMLQTESDGETVEMRIVSIL